MRFLATFWLRRWSRSAFRRVSCACRRQYSGSFSLSAGERAHSTPQHSFWGAAPPNLTYPGPAMPSRAGRGGGGRAEPSSCGAERVLPGESCEVGGTCSCLSFPTETFAPGSAKRGRKEMSPPCTVTDVTPLGTCQLTPPPWPSVP